MSGIDGEAGPGEEGEDDTRATSDAAMSMCAEISNVKNIMIKTTSDKTTGLKTTRLKAIKVKTIRLKTTTVKTTRLKAITVKTTRDIRV